MSFTCLCSSIVFFFFFNDTATSEIYTLSLHDALPILLFHSTSSRWRSAASSSANCPMRCPGSATIDSSNRRSEEHTSELQSRENLVCRLLLEKKKKKNNNKNYTVKQYKQLHTLENQIL